MVMHIVAERDGLGAALSAVSRSVSKSGAAAFGDISLRARGSELGISSRDPDLEVKIDIPVKVVEEGEVFVFARVLADMVKSMPAGSVSLRLESEHLVVSTDTNEAVFRVPVKLDVLFSSSLQDKEVHQSVLLSTSEVMEGLAQVFSVASRDEFRQILTGVLIETDNKTMRAVATDSYRLAIKEIELSTLFDEEAASIIVPARALSEAQRLFSQIDSFVGDKDVVANDKFSFGIGENLITMSCGPVTIRSRRIEGKFPEYSSLMPKEFVSTIVVDQSSIADAIKKVKLVGKDQTTPVQVVPEGDTLLLKVQGGDLGEAEVRIEASISGEAVTLGFNPNFLAEGVELCRNERIVIEQAGTEKPVVIHGEGSENYKYLLMPVKIK
jgi:DNA polymerase-3 subunit beta